ncbi:membrane protein [Thermicanus aegyptius]|uniref:membrane protein n=1 Tax=Thermicanus aegyptius TaxID=94009 RepID=UPI000490D930|nr:membrane protein [Thermicanus aegyptius]
METEKVLKILTGIFELFLAIPFLGIAIVYGFLLTPLFFMFVLHIITLVFTFKNGNNSIGSALGIVASVLGWIPFVSWMLHLLAGIVILSTIPKSVRH